MTCRQAADGQFDVSVVDRDGRVVVVAVGEIDLATRWAFEAAIQQAVDRARPLVLDLSGTTFIDSSGLNAIVQAARNLGGAPDGVVIVGPQPSTLKVLRITGIDTLVTIEDRSQTGDVRPP